MNRHTPLLFLFLLTLISTPIYAQEAEVPWPPRPADIFTDAVELVEMTVTSEYDNEARIVRVYNVDSQTWQEFPYPDEFDHVEYIATQGEVIAVSAVESRDYPTDAPQWTSWVLDMTSGEFTIYVSHCENGRQPYPETWPPQYINVTDTWTFYSDSLLRGRTALCHTRTGEFRGLLPIEVSRWSIIIPSPDGDWLLIGGEKNLPLNPPPILLYGYHLLTDTVNYLGEIPNRSQVYFERWLRGTAGVYYSGYSPQSFERDHFIFNLSCPGSLGAFEGRSSYYGNPPRYEYLLTHPKAATYADHPGHTPCSIDVFDLVSWDAYYFVLGQDCFGVVARAEDHYFYLSYSSESEEGRSLYTLDVQTSERVELFSGEFLALENVSPDGHYAIIVLDDSDWMGYLGDLDPFNYDWAGPSGPHVAIFDIETGERVYETRSGFGRSIWFSNTGFILNEGYETPINERLFTLENGAFTEKTIATFVSSSRYLMRNYPYLLYQLNGQSDISLLDPILEVGIPIIRPLDSENYNLSFEWLDESSLLVTIQLILEDGYPFSRITCYNLHIP